jgi:hypothetical protein
MLMAAGLLMPEIVIALDVTAVFTAALVTAGKLNASGIESFRLKAAFTLTGLIIVTVQVPVPAQAPLQPVKTEPVAATAFSVTEVLGL